MSFLLKSPPALSIDISIRVVQSFVDRGAATAQKDAMVKNIATGDCKGGDEAQSRLATAGRGQ